jgi:hypothetical protein
MYIWLFVVVALIWAWLCGGSVIAAREGKINGFLAFCAVGAWTGLALLAILFIGPYWVSVYQVLLQPG